MFDDEDARGRRRQPTSFGDAFAGRGESLNTAIGAFRPLLRDVMPVAQNLSAPQTHLRRFFRALGADRGDRRPAAETQAELFGDLDRTFRALGERREAVHPGVDHPGPPALTRDPRLPAQRPFLRNSGLFRDLQPGRAALRDAPRRRSPTRWRSACRSLPKTPPRSTAGSTSLLQRGAALLRRPASAARPEGDLTDGAERARTRRCLPAPAQTTVQLRRRCGSATSPRSSVRATRNGTWQQLVIVADAAGPEQRGQPRPRAPPTGPTPANHLHANPYPNTASPGQPKECEAGNEPYGAGQTVIGNVARYAVGHGGGDPLSSRRQPRSPFAVGLIASPWSSSLVYLGFTKDIPFTHGRSSSSGVPVGRTRSAPNSPVRIAGVQVGKVEGSSRGGHGRGRRDDGDRRPRPAAALRRDREDPAAHLPRGQLLRRPPAGHAGGAELHDGDTIKVTQTATPVQLDQVLTSLQSRPRAGPPGPARAAQRRRSTPSRPRRTSPQQTRRRVARPRRSRSTTPTTTSPPPSTPPPEVLRGAARHRAGARRRAADPRHRPHRRRADPQRERAARA